ncbi:MULTISPECIES: energy transducer TonB [Polaribacter]|uniref:Energy transducer TonB n=1 Tax=Polaribacter sejongensis TaxID=985043 RepID=A0AAJ1QUY9_9FLAO|nr:MULTISPECIES: energy transducer TonB [Polaribacter]AUC21782.1 energy transducer TonB [Polaribacter sejongensis]MDN3618410.1 energy transducer TonB [Polaribacter undariae]UWD30606.1 energy transducer TonB [Polaribacter undariae]
MDIKKNPEQQLENYSKIFLQIGLVLALFITYTLIEHKTYERNDLKSLGQANMIDDMKEDIPIIEMQEVIPPPKNTPPPIVEQITVVEDEKEIEETVIESTETDETVGVVVNTDDIVEVEEVEEVVEDIPFILIENVPVYPGCKGNNKALKDCFTKKVTEFFGKRFDINLASELGLDPGKKKLFVIFTINKKGKIANVRARGPHPRLEKEVVEIINALPTMTPGKQRGNPVGVSYSIPITFEVRT